MALERQLFLQPDRPSRRSFIRQVVLHIPKRTTYIHESQNLIRKNLVVVPAECFMTGPVTVEQRGAWQLLLLYLVSPAVSFFVFMF